MVLFAYRGEDLQVLLVRRKHWPYAGHWAIPGGFVHMAESLEEAAQRELVEETGISDLNLEQLYTFGDPGRDPRTRVITVAYFALIGANQSTAGPGAAPQGQALQAGSDAAEARWWSVYDLPPLAFDHDRILRYALQRLRWKLENTALGFLLLPKTFTLSELQFVYEAVLHEKLDKGKFRRKILAADVLEETGELREGDQRPADRTGGPAKLYRFTVAAIELVQANRRSP